MRGEKHATIDMATLSIEKGKKVFVCKETPNHVSKRYPVGLRLKEITCLMRESEEKEASTAQKRKNFKK